MPLTRRKIVVLVVLAALLLLDGGPSSSASPRLASHRGGAPELEAVECAMGRLNPALSPRERERIGRAVLRESERYAEIDPGLLVAIFRVESSGRPWARSPKGALGLMQVMPHMVESLGVAGNHTTIESNIEAGALILAENIRRLGRDDGISAYFWGSDIRGVGYLRRVHAALAEADDLLSACAASGT